MKVNVSIFSRIGEERIESFSRGEISFGGGGFVVRYFTEGDECMLEYCGGVVVQRRSGKLNFTMRFEEGRQTECLLTESGNCFSFPVFTHVSGVSFSESSGCRVALSYASGGSEERTELIFTAERERVPNEKRFPRAR